MDRSEQEIAEMYALRKRLRAVIGCPIDWRALATKCDPEMIWGLRAVWKQTAENHQVDCEMDNYLAMDFCVRGLSIDIAAMEANRPYWRNAAEKSYREKTEFLAKLKFKDPRETEEKHHPRSDLTQAEVIALSRRNSMFFADVALERIERAMWKGIEQAWLHLVNDRPLHLFVQTESPLGASEGEISDVVRFDFDYSNSEVHGHPRRRSTSTVYHEDGADFPEIEDVGEFAVTIDDDFELTKNFWE